MASTAVQIENNRQISTKENSFVEIEANRAYRTEILTGGAEIIAEIFDEWTTLCDEGASDEPFFRPEWFAAFTKSFEKEITLLTVRRGEKLRAVLPLCVKRDSLHSVPVRKLQAVFNLQTPRFDLVHGADESERAAILKSLWTEIKTLPRWDVLEIRMVKKGSWLDDLLALAAAENHRTGTWKMDAAPYISLPEADDKAKLIDDYFKKLSKNRRQLLKKKRRYLEELGAVEVVTTRGFSAELMRKYFDLEASGWKERAGTSVTSDERTAQLHEEFARAVADRNALIFQELKLNGKTIAMYISILEARKTIGWKMSYDENYAKFSPGNLLFIEVLNECMRNGSPELDQLSPATYNKSMWATGEYEHDALYFFRRGIVGNLLYRWKFSIVSGLRKFKSGTPKKAAEIK